MSARRRSFTARNRRGGALALSAVMMVGLLAFMGLSIDVGMWFTARSEAQRAADAAALAGASAFLGNFCPSGDCYSNAAEAEDTARARVYEYAGQNFIRNQPVVPEEVAIQFIPDSTRIRVWVRRQGVQTWFASLVGLESVTVGAVAAAEAGTPPPVSATCVAPFVVPDMWEEEGDEDQTWEEGEEWVFGDEPGDRYSRYGDPEELEPNWTGFGSTFRGEDQDYGRQMQIKQADPNSEFVSSPGLFYPVRLPDESTNCEGYSSGGSEYRSNISSCNQCPISAGDEIPLEPGNMIGPTHQGVRDLIQEDPTAMWNESEGTVEGSQWGDNWMESPRVLTILLMAPDEIQGSGMQEVTVNNIALMFLEEQGSPQDGVTGRFLLWPEAGGGASGSGPGFTLPKILRLVQ